MTEKFLAIYRRGEAVGAMREGVVRGLMGVLTEDTNFSTREVTPEEAYRIRAQTKFMGEEE